MNYAPAIGKKVNRPCRQLKLAHAEENKSPRYLNIVKGHRIMKLPTCNSELVQAVRKQNDTLAKDPRVECVMLPIADGLTLLRVL